MQFYTSVSLLFLAFSAGAYAQQETCNANPECAALGLADDCCPTNLAGIFLDCCDDPATSCAANPGCRGLDDECCPAADGTFLYCCFDNDADGGYVFESNYYAQVSEGALSLGGAINWRHTGRFQALKQTFMSYVRNNELLYDMIYLRTQIRDAGAYVAGDKKFSIDLHETNAPPCTQIILQFEHVPSYSMEAGTIERYPIGRHSRYLLTVPEGSADGASTRIEFEVLDRPDGSVPDDAVNALVILFAPGAKTDYQFGFSNLDSYDKCASGEGCLPSPVKSCPAVYLTIEGGEGVGAIRNRFLQSELDDCSDCENPACIGVGECSMDTSSTNFVEQDPLAFSQVADNSVTTSETDTGTDTDAGVSITPALVDEPTGDTTTDSQVSAATGPIFCGGIIAGATALVLTSFAF